MTHISDIKLIRTDTTLDLSQKAEKVSMGLEELLYVKLVFRTRIGGVSQAKAVVQHQATLEGPNSKLPW
ncbi:hypothetical protein H5410_035307 [Solanum commersonii]|uniref:Uncharacterized protein n=1 Tax=Solanum commersonii TaxID=4109 RepID=A0A9J5Y0A2_SOLCO|nr:hypothetical protein H5410_035307 [Solanum commersonii]